MDFRLKMKRGNDRVLVIRATWPEAIPEQGIEAGDPFSLAGRPVWFTAKLSKKDPDSSAIFQKRTAEAGGSSAEIQVRAAPDEHEAEVTVARADTEALEDDSTLHCHVQVKTPDEKVWTVADGTLTVEWNVTSEG